MNSRVYLLLSILVVAISCKEDRSAEKALYKQLEIERRISTHVAEKLEDCRQDAWIRAAEIVDSTLRANPEKYLPRVVPIPDRPERPERDSFVPIPEREPDEKPTKIQQ